MQECKKPLTDDRRRKLNITYKLLLAKTDYKGVAEGIGYKTEGKHWDRIPRDLISQVACKYPVISLSSEPGIYILPKRETLTKAQEAEYEAICRQQIAEIKSRIQAHLDRLKPLDRWLEEAWLNKVEEQRGQV